MDGSILAISWPNIECGNRIRGTGFVPDAEFCRGERLHVGAELYRSGNSAVCSLLVGSIE